jgi:beta-N-acetylhexosaminidase
VAATMKHVPGLGAVTTDTHHGLGVVEGTADEIRAGALAPFRAAIGAGVALGMSAHVALPAITGDRSLPATLSRAVMAALLRGELGFEGVTISDALDMRALAQGADQAVDVIAAIHAGVDLLLCAADRTAQQRVEATLVAAGRRRIFDHDELASSHRRIVALRRGLADAGAPPGLDVVGRTDHRALARELAERALTPGRGLDPSPRPWIESAARILAVMPRPVDLTPADTSSLVAPGLADALRTRYGSVEEVVIERAPSGASVAAVRARAAAADAVVIGTIDAHRDPGQLELIRAVAETGRPTIAAALRTPWDLAAYPAGIPAIATYSILPGSLEALARVLAGEIGLPGRAPVIIGA